MYIQNNFKYGSKLEFNIEPFIFVRISDIYYSVSIVRILFSYCLNLFLNNCMY